MNTSRRQLMPPACILTASNAAAQTARWRKFNADYLLETDRGPGVLTAHYVKIDDSVARLDELVRSEQTCCAFAQWSIDENHHHLRLTVTADDDALAPLTTLIAEPS